MKQKLSIFTIILGAILIMPFSIRAEIKLPAIFGDNMVLQQQSEAAIWGSASPRETVTVITSWNDQTYTAKSGSDGSWRLKVNTPEAGGPFSISISDGEALVLDNVLIGEVWVCSGQSNMEMPMRGYYNQPVLGANKAIATSGNDNIRLITVERDKSLTPKTDFTGEWKECVSGNVVDFSATAYFFGKVLQEALGVPVGLICSAWGGTRIEPWMGEDGIEDFDWVSPPDKNLEGEFSQQLPTVLFNAMIAPMAGYGIKGAIWYQGEANRNEPAEYEKLLPGLAESWRDEWGIPDFPFYYVQIAPYDYGQNSINSAYIREAMLKADVANPNMGMACIMDAGEEYNIHPANKEAAGDRLAYLALAKTYGLKGIQYSGPVLKEMNIEGSLVKLTFNNADNGLTTFGNELVNFEIAGQNKRFIPAEAFLTRQGITVFSPFVNEPVAVRYAFKNFVVGELFNTEGLPASSFRTDDWEIE
jgi:sialate O-acetylesterase